MIKLCFFSCLDFHAKFASTFNANNFGWDPCFVLEFHYCDLQTVMNKNVRIHVSGGRTHLSQKPQQIQVIQNLDYQNEILTKISVSRRLLLEVPYFTLCFKDENPQKSFQKSPECDARCVLKKCDQIRDILQRHKSCLNVTDFNRFEMSRIEFKRTLLSRRMLFF